MLQSGARSKSMTHQPGVYVPLRAVFLVFLQPCEMAVMDVITQMLQQAEKMSHLPRDWRLLHRHFSFEV